MSRQVFSKIFATFALTGFLLSASPADLFRSWLGSLFKTDTDQGPTVDPNGGHGKAAAVKTDSDEGPGMCPHGGKG
ncbi:MAG TPA: hypothetical protein VH988_15655 [Thermoanaerobaculia bacterium]|jgi:hypothetical protein|nr:hypothetical protein [Thermoanaerobaculia bacterium]